ncbi:hypothetical protein LEP1GSC060_0324 [Leptospira weilii serovar Ranarum str. ICFT]|uniref:Uncharacterized protein n=1 Tax=Leptospira weilii serovar Ranarum str. ICFT TaxID=1218598 RepID=N1W8W2_9LEPT|nr:hypothetical protein LEP1GSC060_0324 [Leptospira weilii serovar Ranarum str. ICFT]
MWNVRIVFDWDVKKSVQRLTAILCFFLTRASKPQRKSENKSYNCRFWTGFKSASGSKDSALKKAIYSAKKNPLKSVPSLNYEFGICLTGNEVDL